MQFPYFFNEHMIVRTPVLPLSEQRSEIDFSLLLNDDYFLEAIYLASPVLYDECIKWREGLVINKKDIDKLTRSLSKYFLRMSSRCTPFGLFSGCAVVKWTKEGGPVIMDSKKSFRHTRLDMHYLCALARNIAQRPSVKEHLLFFPNSSIYTIGNEFRYVEYIYSEEKLSYRISAVRASDSLAAVIKLASQGVTMAEMENLLGEDGIAGAEAREFINELIDTQILMSELEPSITGREFMYQIIAVLERILTKDNGDARYILQVLQEVRDRLKNIDSGGQNNISRYRDITKTLDNLNVVYEEGKLFQTDIFRNIRGNGVNVAMQGQLQEALTVLNKLTLTKNNEALQSFARRFYKRYEDKEMPLLEVMDTETGIGYQEFDGSCISPLVGDLVISGNGREQQFTCNKLEMFLNNKRREAFENNYYTVELTDKELESFSAGWSDLPPSLSVIFRMVDENTVYLESAGGSSAVNLLGRFAHGDDGISELAAQTARLEQENEPGAIYAEIVHLPESRTGNILLHPAFRDYEIPYLAKSSLDKEFQINVQDLYVSVRKERVILRSRRLNKQVIPRLSTAHNYSNNALPVYRFLCDLQLQGKKSALVFNWGNLQYQNRFLPRVIYKNTILHLAKWNFLQEDIENIRNREGEIDKVILDEFKNKWRLPRHIVLSEGDNELLVDLDNPQMVQLWLETVRNKESFIMKEFIAPKKGVTDENDRSYANQFIAVLSKNKSELSRKEARIDSDPISVGRSEDRHVPEKRVFTLGSEWVYFKLYCGVKSADRILLEAIRPMTGDLSRLGLIDKWFFVRYNDPDFHLRVRFHLKDIKKIGDVIMTIHSRLDAFESGGYIWKLQTDTYNREIERYGAVTIGMAETLFYYDSLACVEMLDNTAGDERENIRWLWGLRAVDELLDCFCLSVSEKLALLTDCRNSFDAEFNIDKTAKTQLNDKYRNNKRMIDMIFKNEDDLPSEWYSLVDILKRRSGLIRPIADKINYLHAAGKLDTSLSGLLGSYIHMMLNRVVTAEPRIHELVIYDFLCRYYRSAIARPVFVLSND